MQIDWEDAGRINEIFSNFTQEYLSDKPCRISPETVIEMIEKGEKVLILDIRTDYEKELVGYTLKNSLHIPMGRLFRKENIEKLLDYQDHTIVLSCHKGFRSLVATAFLQKIDIMNTKSLEGGIADFALAVHP